MYSPMMTISLSKENERLKSDMESLQNDNIKLKTELNRLTGELEQRDKLITSLECQIRALLTEQTRPTNNNDDDTSSSTENSPTTKLDNNNNNNSNNNNRENGYANNNIIRPKGRSKPSQGIVHLTAQQLLPPQRSNLHMETPLAPDLEQKEIEKDDKDREEETAIKNEKEEEAKDEINNKGEADGEKDVDPSSVAKEDGKIIENVPKKEKGEENSVPTKPEKTKATNKQKNNVSSTKEEQQGDTSRPILKAGLKSNRNAIKALPREISISNDDDDELTKYSVESSPIVEVETAKMRDAYGVRGIYTGSISRLEKFPHGKGTMEYEDGKIYEGEWHRGHWHGKCSMKSSKGVYTGRVVNDLKEGDGELFYTEGHKFKGIFEQDEPVEGTMTYADKRQYVGKLRNNVMHGKGVLTYPDGSKYSGEFQNGVQHGKGIYHFSDGSVYEGESVMGVYEGIGKMTWNDGGWYEGEWKQGEANGHGMEIRSDGRLRHHGKWRKGVPIRQ